MNANTDPFVLRPYGKLEFIAHNPPQWGREIRLYAHVLDQRNGSPVAYEAKPVVYQPCDEFKEAEAFMRLKPEEARSLMDELWKCGVRPSEIGTGNELAAVKYHLEDMRKIAGVTK